MGLRVIFDVWWVCFESVCVIGDGDGYIGKVVFGGDGRIGCVCGARVREGVGVKGVIGEWFMCGMCI